MHWRVKGAVQKGLGCIPAAEQLHYMMQRGAGGLSDFGRECNVKVDDWRLMMGHLRSSRVTLEKATLLEMGTGWYPTFPLCLFLAGAKRVITLDLNRHLKRSLTRRLAEQLAFHVPLIAREAGRQESTVSNAHRKLAAALRRGATLEAATADVVEYRAPADAAATELPSNSVDVVFSNSVLEHVPRGAIEACLAEAMRVLRPGGLVFHSVNCGDHYAYVDRAIHQLHYLHYSDAQWRKWNNRFLYQNRLRAIDFVELTENAGFVIEIDTSRAMPERLRQLDSMSVHPMFARYTREQLAITSIDLVGRKPA